MTTGPVKTDSTPDVPADGDRNYGLLMGLIAGSVVGVALGMLFAPRTVLDLRKRASDSAKDFGNAAADRCHETTARIGEAVDEITKKGQNLRDDLSDAVVRGAQDVERYATSAKTGR